MTTIQGHKCFAYFGGKDGEGTCDTECQWFLEGSDCPWWFTEDQYEYSQFHKKSVSGRKST